MTDDEIMTAEQVRGCLQAIDRARAQTRARPMPDYIKAKFPPISDEEFRFIMERALLGEVRRPFDLNEELARRRG
jgi:hypothetical protein